MRGFPVCRRPLLNRIGRRGQRGGRMTIERLTRPPYDRKENEQTSKNQRVGHQQSEQTAHSEWRSVERHRGILPSACFGCKYRTTRRWSRTPGFTRELRGG